MAYVARLSREEFLGWLSKSFYPSIRTAPDGQERLGSDEVLFVWQEKPTATQIDQSNPVLAVRSDSLREFFAFTGTYVSTYQPFSAFFRVVPTELLPTFLSKRPSPDLPNKLLGVVIAEARIQSGERGPRPSQISIQAGLATISAAVVNALMTGLDRQLIFKVMKNWLDTRSLLSLERTRLAAERIGQFWNIVSSAFGSLPLEEAALDRSDRLIVRFISDVMAIPEDHDPPLWPRLIEGSLPDHNVLSRMRDSREDRVRAMDAAFSAIRAAKDVDIEIKEVALGYLASRVAQGAMSYLDLLQPMEAEFPMSSLWFGFFCSLRNDTDVLTVGDCLGRRIVRHLSKGNEFFCHLPRTFHWTSLCC